MGMKVSLKDYSLSDLQKLNSQVQTEIKKRSEKDKKAVLQQLRRVAKQHGFELSSLLNQDGAAKPAKGAATKKAQSRKSADKRRKVAPKYRSPDDKSLTWTGRGRQPRWVAEWLSNKGTLEQLAIK
jgi:DNA-binding protein H-NS